MHRGKVFTPCTAGPGPGVRTMRRGTHAFTLIEMLTALAIGLLVLGAVYAALATALRISARQAQREHGELAARAALDALTQDLLQAATTPGDGHSMFTLEPLPPHGMPRIRLTSARPDPGDPHPRRHRVEKVSWEVQRIGEALFLVRTATALPQGQEPSSGKQETLRTGPVHRFTARALDGQTWIATWSEDENGAWPRAVQLVLQLEDDRSTVIQTEIFVPAAMRFDEEPAPAE